MNKLPKKWFIKVKPETRDVLNNWRRLYTNNDLSDFCFDVYNRDLFLYSDNVDYNGSYYTYFEVKPGYEEITFEDFENHILNKIGKDWAIKITKESLPYINQVGHNLKRNPYTERHLGYRSYFDGRYITLHAQNYVIVYPTITLEDFIDKFNLKQNRK